MTEVGLLLSRQVISGYGDRIRSIGERYRRSLRLIEAPPAPDIKLEPRTLASIHGAFYSRDVWQGSAMACQSPASAAFFEAADAAPALRWLHLTSAGVDLAQFPQYAASVRRGLRLTTSSGANAVPIAQSVVAAVLAQARGFVHWLHAQRRGSWSQIGTDALPRDLNDQCAAIIGMGPIGRETGRLLKAVGLRTIGVRRNVAPDGSFDAVLRYDDLDRVLPQVDIIILACPLTDQTRRILNRERLALLRSGAIVVNVGRGELVDEEALIHALDNGKLHSAYLDVFAVEPLPADSPLWRMPNVWISPHNCSASQGNARRVVEIFMDNLARWLQGAPLVNEASRGNAPRDLLNSNNKEYQHENYRG